MATVRHPLRHPLRAYWALAYAITWLGVAPLALHGLGLAPPAPTWLHALGALGPVGAAWLVARRADGPAAGRAVLAGIARPPRDRRWLAVAVGSPLALLALALAVHAALAAAGRAAAPDAPRLLAAGARPAWWGQLAVASLLYGFGEEPGWRGFALPRLRARHPAWRASLLLAVGWAAWHAPMFAYRFHFDGAGTVVGFFVALLAGAFWLTWLFEASGGSVLVVATWHALWNVANLVAAPLGPVTVAALNALMMTLGYAVLLALPRGAPRPGPLTAPRAAARGAGSPTAPPPG